MASESAHEMHLLIQEIGDDRSMAKRDLVHRTMKQQGYGKFEIEDAEDELIRELDAVYESLDEGYLRISRSEL